MTASEVKILYPEPDSIFVGGPQSPFSAGMLSPLLPAHITVFGACFCQLHRHTGFAAHT